MRTSFLIAILSIWFQFTNAQRVFVASEKGKIEELKEGFTKGNFKPITFPNKMINAVIDPVKLYIYSDLLLEQKEWEIATTYSDIADKETHYFIHGPYMKNLIQLKRLSDNFYCLTINSRGFQHKPGEIFNLSRCKYESEIGIHYKPNKENKKAGASEKYWFLERSREDYDQDDIDYSNEDAIASINEIIKTKQTTKQLFASLVPEPQPQVIQGNNQIQYVVVQNQNVPVQGNDVAELPKEPEVPNSDVDVNIPFNGNKIENGFALIIANEDYTKVAPVPFAKRDGKKVEEYMNKALGIDKGHITLLENATLNDMRYELSRLKKISEAYNGDCSFIVYYCGHGIPDEKNGNGYLLPVDGYGTDVNTAYSLAELYSQLGNLNARKTILFTDACFSGAGKEGSMLVAARGIAIKSKANEASGNLIAFSACQGDETAYSYKDKGHGLMTYYFLKKLQESQGKATLGELEEYIIDNVGKTAIVTNGKSQTPSVSVSPTLQNSWRQQTLFE